MSQINDALDVLLREMRETREHVANLSRTAAEQAETMRGVENHLARLNGSVARHEKKIGEQALELLAHVGDCALKNEVDRIDDALKDHLSTVAARQATNAEWVAWLKPIAYVAIGVVGTLALLHAPELLK